MATRFLWTSPLVEVAAAGSPEAQETEDNGRGEQESSASESAPDTKLITHTYVLRKDLTVRFDLPIDLSAAEARRLSGFIGTLPILDDKEDE